MAPRLRNPLRQPAKTLYRRALALYRPWRGTRAKVFGIGLSRTGTKSLHQALGILGYRSDHFSTHLLTFEDGRLGLDWSHAGDYDALTDVTAARFYRDLDARFPGARFILTVRAPQAWLRSCERHFPPLRPGRWPSGVDKVLQLRRELYGALTYDPHRFLEAYQHHESAVRRHFRDRPDDLLVLDITAGEGWGPLCRFLGEPVPARVFPWANRTGAARSGRPA